MPRTSPGSFRLFTLAGIDVFLHWTWLVVAYVEISFRTSAYESRAWNVAEYLALFGIVLLHEFGHAFACRSVGGQADTIVLWPLGGIAFVSPPPRPGAVLWSIAAGPLVNVVLVPVTVGLFLVSLGGDVVSADVLRNAPLTDLSRFLSYLAVVNGILLVFNLLPVYPLDGGQILQSLLWFFVGYVRSLRIVSVVGLLVGVAVLVPLLLGQQFWLALMAAFVILRSWHGLQLARAIAARESQLRPEDGPPAGEPDVDRRY